MSVTISSDLKRQAVIHNHLKALKRILTPLLAFARSHNNVPLQGTNEIVVPYISLDTTASTDWNASNGYVAGDGTVGAKKITVNKRKYQSLGTDSATQTNQPFALTDELLEQKLDTLCSDVVTDVTSAITAANFGLLPNAITGANSGDLFTSTAHGLLTGDRVDIISITGGTGFTAGDTKYAIRVSDTTFQLADTQALAIAGTATAMSTDCSAAVMSAAAYTGVASGFNIAGVSLLKRRAIDARWPENRRHLVLNSSYDQYAMMDSAVLGALTYGSAEAIRDGRVPRVLGFDYHGGATVPTNSQSLGGFISMPSSILFGCAPIQPLPGVMRLLSAYEQYTIPELDIVISYRRFADAQMDTEQEIVECTYGYAVGEPAALKRIAA